jgi:hypothetical protein
MINFDRKGKFIITATETFIIFPCGEQKLHQYDTAKEIILFISLVVIFYQFYSNEKFHCGINCQIYHYRNGNFPL